MSAVPKPGEFYRHFKNRMYQIITVAKHSETGERMVVYQALYGDFSVWARPLSMFMEEVNSIKYPDAGQKLRFERVFPKPDRENSIVETTEAEGETSRSGDKGCAEGQERSEEDGASPLLLEFLDTESFEDRINLLQSMKGRVGQREVDSLCFCLDVKPSDGTIEDQLENLQRYLRMQQRYDASRLRRR